MTTKSDADIALDFLHLIPSGRWTNYGEIAECVMAVTPERKRKLTGFIVAHQLLHGGPDQPWHRLRNAKGLFVVPGTERRNHAEVQRELDQKLRDEGCTVSGGHAHTSGHITASQLLRIADVKVERVPNVLSVEAQRRVDERVAERVARLNRG